jgi:hypothetical protein
MRVGKRRALEEKGRQLRLRERLKHSAQLNGPNQLHALFVRGEQVESAT